jgi:hypothetical protein
LKFPLSSAIKVFPFIAIVALLTGLLFWTDTTVPFIVCVCAFAKEESIISALSKMTLAK